MLWGGVLLLVKVVAEDYADGVSGLLSLDMRERVVREKLGSGLVVLSMTLQLKISSDEGKVEERQSSARLGRSGEFKSLLLACRAAISANQMQQQLGKKKKIKFTHHSQEKHI